MQNYVYPKIQTTKAKKMQALPLQTLIQNSFSKNYIN